MKKEPRLLLVEILEFIYKIELAKASITQDQFFADFRHHDLLMFLVFQVGEHVHQLPEDLLKQYPDVPWRKIIGTRHLIGHDYGKVIHAKIWEIASVNIPELKSTIQQMLVEVA